MAESVLKSFSRAERQLVHCIGFLSAVRHDDDRVPVVMMKLSDILKSVSDRPATAKVVAAARSLMGAYPQRNQAEGGAGWARARMEADAICLQFHWLSIGDLDGAAHG